MTVITNLFLNTSVILNNDMAIKQLKEGLEILKKLSPRPYNYMRFKYTIDSIFAGFNWETMSEKDLKESLKIIVEATSRFYAMKTWQPPYEGKYKKNIDAVDNTKEI